MTERKGAAYRITSKKPAYSGQEHHQRTHVSEMYERMAQGPTQRVTGALPGSTWYHPAGPGSFAPTKAMMHSGPVKPGSTPQDTYRYRISGRG